MKLFSILSALLFFAAQGLPPLVGPLIPDNTGVVTGIVRRADTSRPISDAQVALMSKTETPVQAMTHAVVTDANGRFTIKNVAGGDYKVIAQAEGHFKPADDTPSAPWVTTDIYAFEGQQLSGIILEMIPGATISGRVESADGERVAEAPVEALQANYVNGRMTLKEVKATATDDLGEYRLFWLPPGDYYVRARYRLASADRPERYAPVFFPGISDQEVAPSVMVTPASESSAIDVRISKTPIGGVTISGRVTDAELADRVVTAVYVVPRDRSVTLVTDMSDAIQNEASDSADGQFVIREVPRGEYNLFPIVKDGEGNLRMARISVDVEDKNIEGLSGALAPTVELRGRVTLDGEASGGEVALTSLDGVPGILLGASNQGAARAEAEARVKVDPKTGEFVFPRVNPGQYSLRLASPLETPDAYVADLRQKDNSVFALGFPVGEAAPDPLELMIRSQGGTVSGTVFDSTLIRPFARATVALVPDDPHRRNFVLYRTAVTLPDGTFNLTGIAPGSYKLFAWQTITSGVWGNTAFIRRHEDRGVPVVVEENVAKSVRLQVIAR
jgi:5-hydroxyisourate hydrolase-like protein (transthyretin family)